MRPAYLSASLAMRSVLSKGDNVGSEAAVDDIAASERNKKRDGTRVKHG
jgi:hypothetical protein